MSSSGGGRRNNVEFVEFTEEKLLKTDALRQSLHVVDHALENLKDNAKKRIARSSSSGGNLGQST